MVRDLGDLRDARFTLTLNIYIPNTTCYFITPWYHSITSPEDKAMLGSNLSAVAGDGNMEGGRQFNACCPFCHVFVFKALNPRALARNVYPVGPPEA